MQKTVLHIIFLAILLVVALCATMIDTSPLCCNGRTYNLVKLNSAAAISATGLKVGTKGNYAIGAVNKDGLDIRFISCGPSQGTVDFALSSPFSQQNIRFIVNGSMFGNYEMPNNASMYTGSLPVTVHRGVNIIRLIPMLWNGVQVRTADGQLKTLHANYLSEELAFYVNKLEVSIQ